MKKFLIVGLGNIGEKYEHTRHNIGFDILDSLAKERGTFFSPAHFGLMAKVNYKGRLLVLLKPDTYVNLSGNGVKYWLKQLKIYPENLMIILDDLSLPYGKIRIKAKGSDGGHNGLKSIQQTLNTHQYPRLRFGIGNHYEKGRQVDFVLGKWTKEEQERIAPLMEKAAHAILSFSFQGLTQTMNIFNE